MTVMLQGGVTQMRFQPRAGRLLAAAAENVVSIFDVESETRIHSLQVMINLGNKKPCWFLALEKALFPFFWYAFFERMEQGIEC